MGPFTGPGVHMRDLLKSVWPVGEERDSSLLTWGQASFPSCSVKVQAREVFTPSHVYIAWLSFPRCWSRCLQEATCLYLCNSRSEIRSTEPELYIGQVLFLLLLPSKERVDWTWKLAGLGFIHAEDIDLIALEPDAAKQPFPHQWYDKHVLSTYYVQGLWWALGGQRQEEIRFGNAQSLIRDRAGVEVKTVGTNMCRVRASTYGFRGTQFSS